MIRKIKLKDSEESRVWVSSDWHAHHKLPAVFQERGFDDMVTHARTILESVNENVRENDTLIYLGDGFLNSTPEKAKNFLRQIICKNILWIWGNHHGTEYKIYKEAKLNEYGEKFNSLEIYPLRWHNVTFLGRVCDFEINGNQLVIASHFPFEIFNRQKHGAFHISGHSHSKNPNTRAECNVSKRLDCDWGYLKRPISYREIVKIMGDKKHISVDGRH